MTVSAIVLAYGSEPWLRRSVHTLLDSRDVDVEVVLVDNGCTDGAVDELRGLAGLTLVGDGSNLGFSAGNNLGVAASSGDLVALVNGDLVAAPDMLARLAEVATRPEVGVVGASVRLADDPERLNSAGNEIHFLGFSWCGHFGERAEDAVVAPELATVMGAALMLRRDTWDRLGGFEPEYFAFHEDADLCWRAHQLGLRVVYAPQAVGVHRYEFGRVGRKMYLAERNRLIFVVSCWERATLLLLAPALAAMELATLVAAARQGWLRQKLDGWSWLWRHRRWLGDRRRRVQAARTVSDRELAPLLSDRLRAGNFELPAALAPLDQVLALYWALVRRVLPR